MAWPETEVTLDELLKEPITRLVMRRDGVSETEIRQLMARLDSPPRERRSFGKSERPAEPSHPSMT